MSALRKSLPVLAPLSAAALLAAGFLSADVFLYAALAVGNVCVLYYWCSDRRLFAGIAVVGVLLASMVVGAHLGRDEALLLPIFAGSGAAALAVLYLAETRPSTVPEDVAAQEDRAKAAKKIRQEIAYYEDRRAELVRHGQQRRQLAAAARDFGGLLDPAGIQATLVQTARALFPDQPVSVSTARQDSIDAHVFQRRQPVLSPAPGVGTVPAIAAPISVQRAVVGVLRVGGAADGRAYTRDDLRLLDVLSNLASLALDNCALFQQAEQSALRDNLTGLLTHRAFQERLEAVVLEASRYGQPFSLLFADLDHFKAVNDGHGHPAGDAVLQGFAHVLDRNVRPVDIVARYGGEEFAVILLQTTHAAALAVAESIRRDWSEQWFDTPGGGLSATTSIGVATFPDDATSAQQLVRQADERVYAAKKNGRNQVRGRAA